MTTYDTICQCQGRSSVRPDPRATRGANGRLVCTRCGRERVSRKLYSDLRFAAEHPPRKG